VHSNQFTIKAKDDVELHVNEWLPDSEPWAVVQIAHGMVEHSERYSRFAEKLTSHGIAVYANDHRGHGKTAKTEEEKGHFADDDGWMKVVNDMKLLTISIQQKYPNLPVILFGHSIGSFLSRLYAQNYGSGLSGLILSGTGTDPGFMGSLGLMIAKRELKKKGKRAKSELMNKLIFGGYNRAFKPTRTPFDWLSRDEKEVDKYIRDPECGYITTTCFYVDMIKGLKDLDQPERLTQIPKELPIYFISGDKDPVGGNGKGVMKVYRKLKEAGIKDVSYRLYEGARHELLNETNREEVTEDVINWIHEKIKN
jgi:alpha-beta hydrolase superfamily lysophospholipase